MPHPWQFHGWVAANCACRFIGHSKIAAFVVHRSNANQPAPLYGAGNSHFNYHKFVTKPIQFLVYETRPAKLQVRKIS